MTGFNVLHSLSFDAFGLPGEQHAVQTGTHPRIATEVNIERYRAQLDRLGMAYDWRRSSATTDPSFYRWTQWIFLQIFNAWYDPALRKARPIAELIAEFESGIRAVPGDRTWDELDPAQRRRVVDDHRLAYVAHTPVNWCPALGTELHDFEITTDGRSERGNFPVFRRNVRQWMMRITAYADRLLADLDLLDWPETVKARQRHWIGRATDWLFSRPRYWGEPFPIVYDESGQPVALPESMLPVDLPEIADFSPRTFAPDDATSEPDTPLASATGWVEVELDLGDGPKRYRRETNTMMMWAGTCWFFLRHLDPTNDAAPFDSRTPSGTGPGRRTTPTRVVWTCTSVVSSRRRSTCCTPGSGTRCCTTWGTSPAPSRSARCSNQGYVQAYSYADRRGVYVEAEQVVQRDGKYFHGQQEVTREYGRLAKSLKNLVTPDEICARYGADTFRVCRWRPHRCTRLEPGTPTRWSASTGSCSASGGWPSTSRPAVAASSTRPPTRRDRTAAAPDHSRGPRRHGSTGVQRRDRQADRTDQPGHRRNRRIRRPPGVPRGRRTLGAHVGAVRAAPRRGAVAEAATTTRSPTPTTRTPTPHWCVSPAVTYPVQVNGKVRGPDELPTDASEADVRAEALAAVAANLGDREPRTVIIIPGKIVNVVL